MIDGFMKAFDYLWVLTITSFAVNAIQILAAYYLGIVLQYGFKGVMYSNLSYLFGLVFLKLSWFYFFLDVRRDMHLVTFNEEDDD